MRIVPLVALMALLSGCAFGKYGRAGVPGQSPSFASGMPLEQVVESIGAPDRHVQVGDVDYLGYDGMKGWWVNLLVFSFNIGDTDAGSLELRFEESKLVSQQYVNKGESSGIWTIQGSIQE